MATINDEDIIPATGTNPFKAGGLTLSGKSNTYELFVTPKGDQGYSNKLKYASDAIDAPALVLIYRIVMDDTYTTGDGWGSVPAPTMRVRAAGIGKLGFWMNLNTCADTNTQKLQEFTDTKLSFQEGTSDVSVNCTVFNMENNFVAYDDDQYFKMPHDRHLVGCGNRQMVYSKSSSSDLIIIVGGKLYPSADARYLSVSMVDIYPPGKNIKTVTDSDLRKFYKATTDTPQYMVAFYPSLSVAQRCKINFPITPYQVLYGYSTSSFPGVVYREVLGEGSNPNLQANLRPTCELTGDCGNPLYWSKAMGDYYPMIAYIQCNRDGTWGPAPALRPNLPPPHLPTPAPTSLWQKLEANGTLRFCVPKMTIDVVAWQGFDLWVNNKYVTGATSANKAVTGLGLEEGWPPYDVSIDASGQVVLSDPKDDFMPDTVTLAVRVPVGEAPAFFVDYDMCGYTSNTGVGWKCSANAPAANWTKPDYDDSAWMAAKLTSRSQACNSYPDSTGCNYVQPSAHGIWMETCPGANPPISGYIYCRLTLPQKCDRSCSANLDPVTAACPDRSNAVGFARTMSPGLYSVFVNGLKLGQDYSGRKDTLTKPFPVDPISSTIVLAVSAIDDSRRNTKAGFIGEFEVCGTKFVTDPFWKCTSVNQLNDDWAQLNYDDSDWVPARVRFGANGALPLGPATGVAKNAYWIWGENYTQVNGVSYTYCRATVPNPLYKTPPKYYTFKTTTSPISTT